MYRNKNKHQEGQALLIVVLIMVIVLTIGLSVASRSITNVRNATEDIESQRAFSAAEAGVKIALKNNKSLAGDQKIQIDSTHTQPVVIKSADVNTQKIGQTGLLNGGNIIPQDEGVDVWFVEHDQATGKLDFSSRWNGKGLNIDWDINTDVAKTAALEIILLSGSQDAPTMTKYAVDPYESRAQQTGFSNAVHFPDPGREYTDSGGGKKFLHYTIQLNGITNPIVMRIIPLYKNAFVGIYTSDSTPLEITQGLRIDSVGASGNTQRKISYFQSYPSVPAELFQYALLSY